MKTKPEKECQEPLLRECQERLLREVFAEDFDISEQISQQRNMLLREFRLAYWRRAATRALFATAAMLLIGVLTSICLREAPHKISSSLSRPHVASSIARTPATISDEELLRLFPPNSCFLAELNGKQVLVFKDPKLSGRFLH